jgi:MFS family permease
MNLPSEVFSMSAATAQSSLLATRRGKLILLLLCSVAFLDFVDVTIVNVALPSIRHGLHMSVQNLQWIPSAYLLTYGGFMLLGGRAADLLGRRRVLVAGTSLFGLASIMGGLTGSAGVLIAARLAQGAGAAMMLPAALSILTTTFNGGGDRRKALGAWGGVAGLASAVGVLLGGVLTQGPGWRWVFFVNPPICLLVLAATIWLISGERRHAQFASFDLRGAGLSTGGMLLLVYGIVRAGALGLAIFAAIATSHTGHLLAARAAMPAALTSGFRRALLASSLSLVLAAAIATRTSNTRNESGQDALVLQPQPEMRVNAAA